LLLYFHGRSTLATWLRSVLAQRYVDRVRARRRTEPLPDDDSTLALASSAPSSEDPERPRYVALLQHALAAAVSRMAPRDRLRLGCYYAQGLTLALIGRLLGEHEATVSRHLARTRRAIRNDIETQLRQEAQLTEAQIRACFESVMSDSGSIDLGQMIAAAPEGVQADLGGNAGKVSHQDRSR
jgi:RNA polymerase sigma factor (sigma-70 family)